ncbi:MAG: GHKL domain-containing protein, partial [Leptospiraceae bacterium]|nr:GHKL domain-containing protein [Leptospiraceae bacterium]
NQTVLNIISENLQSLLEDYSNYEKKEKKFWNKLFELSSSSQKFLDTNTSRKIKKALIKYFSNKGTDLSVYLLENLTELGITEDNIKEIEEYFELKNYKKIIENSVYVFTIIRSGGIIKNSAEKASMVIKALKNYVHQDPFEKRSLVDIKEQIEMCLTLYRSKIKVSTEIIINFSVYPVVVGYKDQLSQVWINLLNNALHAINYKGKIDISSALEGDFMVISFYDNGPGIPIEIQSKIFEPLFTTKEAGEGSGLGLDICRKIVEKHNGRIEFSSRPGETIFKVYLDRNLTQED